jgi:hypothetical protein
MMFFTARAVVFAIITAFLLFKQRLLKARIYAGISLLLVALHYIFYTIYNFYVGLSFDWLMLVDVWTIPFFGLGIAIILSSARSPRK